MANNAEPYYKKGWWNKDIYRFSPQFLWVVAAILLDSYPALALLAGAAASANFLTPAVRDPIIDAIKNR